MSKIKFEEGQFVVYTNNQEQARMIMGKEFARFDEIRYLMSELVEENGQAWENFMTNSAIERLNIHFNDETSWIFDEDDTAKGKVRHQRTEDGRVKTDKNGYYLYELAYRYPDIEGHNADFRLAHEIGQLMLNPSSPKRQTHDKMTNTRQVAGLMRVPNSQVHNSNAIYGEKLQESAINLLAQLSIRGEHSADDILTGKIDLSESNSYKKCDDLIKLLVVSMRNDFDKEISFEQLMKQKIDSIIKHSDGTQESANTFFYGMLNDSSIIEIEFDKYMGKGAWRQLDAAIAQLHKQHIGTEKFKAIFEATQGKIIEFANTRMQDKHKQATERAGDAKIPGLKNKMQMIKTMKEIQDSRNIEPEVVQEQSQPTLSLKQRVAQFLRNNNIFMNLTFVENFVNKQLNVFPTNESSAQIAKKRLKQAFENRISNNGELKNMPTSSRMSDSEEIAKMQEKMQPKPKTEGRE